MTTHIIDIDSHREFELGVNLKRKIRYSIKIPDGKITGLVLYIPGFGDDAGDYRRNFQKHIASEYGLACLTVDYHCLFCRPGNGGRIGIEEPVVNLLRCITGCVGDENVNEVLNKLKEIQPDPDIVIKIPATIYPKNNEYQNFGILPALDNIYAINDVFIRFPMIPRKIYAIGSSYGGYIANLISKFAPATLNAVFDNSSWAASNMAYILGGQTGIVEFQNRLPNKISLDANTISPWSHLNFMPNAFNTDRNMIRSFPVQHIKTMKAAGKNKTLYRCVHSDKDQIADPDEKLAFVEKMKQNGFNIRMTMHSEQDVDGKYIKTMNHGMDLSMREFFRQCYQGIVAEIDPDETLDYDYGHTLTFMCETQEYTVTYTGNSQPNCTILDLP